MGRRISRFSTLCGAASALAWRSWESYRLIAVCVLRAGLASDASTRYLGGSVLERLSAGIEGSLGLLLLP